MFTRTRAFCFYSPGLFFRVSRPCQVFQRQTFKDCGNWVFYRPDDLPATKSCLSIEGKFIFITKAKGHETLASLLVAFHALDVVINESFQYAMSVTVINDVLWGFVIISDITVCAVWSEWFGSDVSDCLHCITNITWCIHINAHSCMNTCTNDTFRCRVSRKT